MGKGCWDPPLRKMNSISPQSFPSPSSPNLSLLSPLSSVPLDRLWQTFQAWGVLKIMERCDYFPKGFRATVFQKSVRPRTCGGPEGLGPEFGERWACVWDGVYRTGSETNPVLLGPVWTPSARPLGYYFSPLEFLFLNHLFVFVVVDAVLVQFSIFSSTLRGQRGVEGESPWTKIRGPKLSPAPGINSGPGNCPCAAPAKSGGGSQHSGAQNYHGCCDPPQDASGRSQRLLA